MFKSVNCTSDRTHGNVSCDEGLKSSSYLLEAAKASIHDIESKSASSPSAASLAFGYQGSFFEWASAAEEAWRTKRLGKAMQQLHRTANGNVITG